MADIQENLFKAMDIIVSKRLTDLAYDKTIIGTITDDSNASKGEYELTDGSTTFTAYSGDLTFRRGNKVYVSVPNADFTLQKNIVGKVVSEDSEYFTYVPPLENYIDITGNLVEDYGSFQNGDGTWSLLANSEDVLEKTIWKANIPNGKDYKRLGIRAEFRSWLRTFNVNNGNYGLRLDVVTTVPQSKDDGELVDNHYYYSFYLDSDDMYGNPYAFESFFSQEKLFDLSNLLGQITSMQLVFYQRYNFLDRTGKLIEHEGMIDNLFITNPYISLGYDIDEFTEDTALLYTLDSDAYNNGLSASSNRKTLQLRWIHVGEDGNIYSVDSVNEIPEQARIHWYHYELSNTEAIDPLAGAFWTEITNSIDQIEVVVDPDTTEATQKYKVIIECPSTAYLEYEVDNDDYLEKLRTNAVALESNQSATAEDIESAWQAYNDYLNSIMNKHTVYQSEILEFISAVPTYDKGTIDLINGLDIVCDEDGYNGVYLLYNPTGVIQNPVEATKMRVLEATYTSLVTGEADLDTAESIIWRIPIGSNTMIYPPEQGKEYDVTDGVTSYWTSGGFAYIKRMSNNADSLNNDAGDAVKLSAQQKFRVKDYFMESATNNIVYCYVVKNNIGYEAAYEMTFGTRGTNGTDYTFKMSFDSDAVAFTRGDTSPIRINLELYDYNNEEVPNFWTNGIQISWYCYGSHYASLVSGADDIVFCDALGNTLSKEEITITQPYFYVRSVSGHFVTNHDVIVQANINVNVTAAAGMTELGNVWLETYLPLPWRTNETITGIEGTTRIVYNSSGVSPDYYKGEYKVYENNVLSTRNLSLLMVLGNYMIPSFYPIVDGLRLIVPSVYSENVPRNMTLCIRDVDTGEFLWMQPLMMYRDRYSSAMLNSWSGDLTIDEKNGTILSTMIGVGIREFDNSYSGIIMGDATDSIDNTMKIGLYGFNHGEQSFGWKVDGTGFLGKSGQGQIIFDGNSGTIKSGVWSNTNGQIGMEIDLDGPYSYGNQASSGSTLKMRGISGKFEVDTSQYSTELVRISGKLNGSDRDLFVISNGSGNESSDGAEGTDAISTSSSYYLQSLNFNASSKNGTRLDLQNGKLTSYGNSGRFELATNTNTFFRLSDINNNVLMVIKSSYSTDGNGTSSRYYLQSSNFNARDNTGTRLDLQNGKFTTYGTAGRVVIDSNNSSRLFEVVGKNSSETNVPLIYIGSSQYYLQSVNYVAGRSGTRIDLSQGRIASHNFTIEAISANNEIVTVSSSESHPISVVGGSGHFWVDWSGNVSITGSLTASNIQATRSGKVGPFNINSNCLYTGGASINGSGVYLGADGLGVASGNFQVDAGGNVYMRGSANISGNTDISGSLTTSGDTSIGGSLRINGNSYINGNLSVYGSINSVGSGTNYNFGYGSASIGGWTITEDSITSKNGDTVLGSDGNISIRGGYDAHNNMTGHFRMGLSTTHPDVSGLNVRKAGIAFFTDNYTTDACGSFSASGLLLTPTASAPSVEFAGGNFLFSTSVYFNLGVDNIDLFMNGHDISGVRNIYFQGGNTLSESQVSRMRSIPQETFTGLICADRPLELGGGRYEIEVVDGYIVGCEIV